MSKREKITSKTPSGLNTFLSKKPKTVLGFIEEETQLHERGTVSPTHIVKWNKTFPAIPLADVEKILNCAVKKHLGAWSVALLESENRYAPLLLEIRKGLLGSELGIKKKDVEDGQLHEVFHSHPSKKEIESLLFGIQKKERRK